jgi:protein-arginine kinase activator protein McsA
MDLSKIDQMIAERQNRIQKRKDDGTLFEEEFKEEENQDEKLSLEVEETKKKMEERLQERIPNCPQCGLKMTYMPEQGMVACQDCGVGMRV